MKLFGKGLLAATLIGLMSTSAMADPFEIHSTDIPVALPVGGVITSTLEFPVTDWVFEDLNVNITFSHQYFGDTEAVLISPSGHEISLFRPFGAGAGTLDARFDDDAAQPLHETTVPYTGTYKPRTPLAGFLGSPTGTWTLRLDDAGQRGPGGTLHAWSIDGEIAPNPEPGSIVLCALGAVGIVWHRRRRRKLSA